MQAKWNIFRLRPCKDLDLSEIYYNTPFWIAYPDKVCYNMSNLLTEG